MIDPAQWLRLIRRVARRLRSADDAEDLLHDAYLRLAAAKVRPASGGEAAYMVRTAVNLAIDAHRRDRLMDRGGLAEARCLAMPDPAPLQDEVVEARVRLERVWARLNELSPRTREVFLLHRLDGMKYREIAARLEISQSAVEKHIAKAALHLTLLDDEDA